MSALGAPRLHLRSTDSTNERARELALAGAPALAAAPPGSSILMSLILRTPPELLPLIAAVAVCDVVGEDARIKWPNDVVLEQPASAPEGPPRSSPGLCKLAGILAEGRPQQGWAVLGIGLNVAVSLDELPAELRGDGAGAGPLPAATMGLGRDRVEPTLALLLAALQRRLGEPAEATLAAWRERDALRGREVAWATGEGRAEGIDGLGRLVVVLADGGRTSLGSGEVHLARIS